MIITFSPPPQCSQCLKTLDSPRRLILETEKSFDKLHALKYKFYFKVLLCTICVTMHFSLCLLSWMKTRLKQAKQAQIAHETEPSWRLPDHPDGVGPIHHPSLHCPNHEDDFNLLQCLILIRDMLSQRLKTAILVTVAGQNGPLRRQKVS